jgi:hypothetical protein
MAAIVAAFGLLLDCGESQAQSVRNVDRGVQNRGISTRVYRPNINRGYAYPNTSRAYRNYTPNYYDALNYQTYRQYGYPNSFSYGNDFRNSGAYHYPSSYGYRNNYGNYSGYRQSFPDRFRMGNSGFYYQRYLN